MSTRPTVDRRPPAATSMQRLQAEAISCNRAFAQLQPLAPRIRTVSLNAEIAASELGASGAPFGVVAQTLGRLSDELAALVHFEDEFASVVCAIGGCIKATNLERLADRAAEIADASWLPALERVCEDEVTAIHRELARFDDTTRELARRLERVRTVALIEGPFVGTNAMIESTRIDDGSGRLQALADKIRDVTETMSAAAMDACDRMDNVRTLAAGVRVDRNRVAAHEGAA